MVLGLAVLLFSSLLTEKGDAEEGCIEEGDKLKGLSFGEGNGDGSHRGQTVTVTVTVVNNFLEESLTGDRLAMPPAGVEPGPEEQLT